MTEMAAFSTASGKLFAKFFAKVVEVQEWCFPLATVDRHFGHCFSWSCSLDELGRPRFFLLEPKGWAFDWDWSEPDLAILQIMQLHENGEDRKNRGTKTLEKSWSFGRTTWSPSKDFSFWVREMRQAVQIPDGTWGSSKSMSWLRKLRILCWTVEERFSLPFFRQRMQTAFLLSLWFFAKFGILWSCWPVLASLGQCWPVSSGLGRCWPVSSGVGRSWPVWAGVGRSWPVWAGLGRCGPVLAGVGRSWSVFAGVGRSTLNPKRLVKEQFNEK